VFDLWALLVNFKTGFPLGEPTGLTHRMLRQCCSIVTL
jgi:hypothetical protein